MKITALNITICFRLVGIFVFRKTNIKCYTKMPLFSFTILLLNTQNYDKILRLNGLKLEHSILLEQRLHLEKE